MLMSEFCITLQRLDECSEDMEVLIKSTSPWSAAQLAKGEIRRIFPGSNWRVKSWRRLTFEKAVSSND